MNLKWLKAISNRAMSFPSKGANVCIRSDQYKTLHGVLHTLSQLSFLNLKIIWFCTFESELAPRTKHLSPNLTGKGHKAFSAGSRTQWKPRVFLLTWLMPWRRAQSAAWLIIAVRQTNTFRLQVATLADFYTMMTLEVLCFSMTLRLCSVCCMSKRIENKNLESSKDGHGGQTYLTACWGTVEP